MGKFIQKRTQGNIIIRHIKPTQEVCNDVETVVEAAVEEDIAKEVVVETTTKKKSKVKKETEE